MKNLIYIAIVIIAMTSCGSRRTPEEIAADNGARELIRSLVANGIETQKKYYKLFEQRNLEDPGHYDLSKFEFMDSTHFWLPGELEKLEGEELRARIERVEKAIETFHSYNRYNVEEDYENRRFEQSFED